MRSVFAALLLTACSMGSASDARDAVPPLRDANDLERAAATITDRDMIARIGFLADDALRGRDTPSPGLEVAAAYLASEFRALGLEPAGDDGSYIQRYPFPLRGLDPAGAALRFESGTHHYQVEYAAGFAAEPGRITQPAASLVYVGARIDPAVASSGSLRDRAVLVDLPGTPPAEGAALPRELRIARSAALRSAAEAGAAAVIFALDPAWGGEALGALARRYEAPARTLGEPIAAFYVSSQAVRQAFEAASLDPAAARVRAQTGPVTLAGVAARLAAPARTIADDRAPNVVAVLRGSDPELRDTYVVFSAHMDHVGVGRPDATGDSIYNGADDDASGTSALVEIAEAFASLPTRPARSVMFLAVSGEEKGLLGSQWYSDHPTVPVERIVANVNMDMIARNAPDTIVVIGQEYSSLGPLVREVARERSGLRLAVAEDQWPEERFFFRSDHFNFARKEIPALFFFAGVHEDYHRPSDELETVDADKAARVARLAFYTAHAIASDRTAPRWTEQGLREVRALTR